MRISSFTEAPARPAFAQVVIGMAGALHLLTGVALLFAPAWFFAIIGTFPPFNRLMKATWAPIYFRWASVCSSRRAPRRGTKR